MQDQYRDYLGAWAGSEGVREPGPGDAEGILAGMRRPGISIRHYS